jgi:hypothetical protein
VALEAELASLRAQIAKNSANSSIPPSQDSIGAKAKQKKASSQRVRYKDRKRGGQLGHKGSGLEPALFPDRTGRADPSAGCPGCGAGLSDAADAGASWTQMWDVPPIELEKICWILPRRRCGCCRTTTTAAVPFGQAAAGFDTAMTTALAAEPVMCGDETPASIVQPGHQRRRRGSPGCQLPEIDLPGVTRGVRITPAGVTGQPDQLWEWAQGETPPCVQVPGADAWIGTGERPEIEFSLQAVPDCHERGSRWPSGQRSPGEGHA